MDISDERGIGRRVRYMLPPKLGRVATRLFNMTMNLVPFRFKYRLGSSFRRKLAPYRFLQPTDTVVQIGSARDILYSGRSRAIHLSMFVPQGRVIVIEADKYNCDALQGVIDKYQLHNITLIRSGAWNKKTTLEFLSNPDHPASNLVRDAHEVLETPVDFANYTRYAIEVDTVDNILRRLGVTAPKMICITTNGSEIPILQGLTETMARGCRYINLAPTGKDYIPQVEAMGYRYIVQDDRGYFFERLKAGNAKAPAVASVT